MPTSAARIPTCTGCALDEVTLVRWVLLAEERDLPLVRRETQRRR